MHRIVFLRHGQSVYNREHEFTGWTDIDLTEAGVEKARRAGEIMRAHGFVFDEAHTSLLRRAIKTLWNALDELDLMWIPVNRTWRLNEKHYGALQELNKDVIAQEMGAEQLKIWRRSYATPPPPLADNDRRHPKYDPRYQGTDCPLPPTESLKDCVDRVMPYWNEVIVPKIHEGKELLVVAHGNSLRSIVKYLDGITDEDIAGLNIPTAIPLVYELDENLKPIKHYYLGNQEEINKAINDVAKEGQK